MQRLCDSIKFWSHGYNLLVMCAPTEDRCHCIFVSPFFIIQWSKLHNKMSPMALFSLQTVMHGSPNCSLFENIQIFAAMQYFISATNRFKQTEIG